ncbi:hypothetical protein HIM_07186 [Hirsutella minnesotensis 3608]|uniref:SMP-30/Gluconolactonase/LRE-like region domain-containing protein n=1 Tax=Hirsutella minnesotensis 3608 TaxID=1043627 RepID=A0A0F7ZZ07_9HYPO|nr:hypothetical protein HIM_07186 [Hirsutella minnesotensis 3608]
MGTASIIFVLVAALLSPFLYERWQLLSTLQANAPHRLVKVNTFKSHEIRFADRIRSCEDVLMLEDEGLALLACDPGRETWNTVMGVFESGPNALAGLYLYDYKLGQGASDQDALKSITFANFTGAADLHTLGIAFDRKTSTVFVTSHHPGGSRIETFKLDVAALVATHTGTIQHPLVHAPNAMVVVDSGELYVTNDHYFTARQSRLMAQLENFLGLPLGSVVRVRLDGGRVEASVVARVPFANGIEVINSTTVAVASTSRGAVYLYTTSRDGDSVSFTYHSQLRVPFMPDNLSLSNGKLMIAGHGHIQSLIKFVETRRICNHPDELAKATAEMREYCNKAESPSWVSEWSEAEGLKHLYVDTEYPSSATATRDASRGVGIVAGLYAKGILVWRD